jgi:hypothetical protein
MWNCNEHVADLELDYLFQLEGLLFHILFNITSINPNVQVIRLEPLLQIISHVGNHRLDI